MRSRGHTPTLPAGDVDNAQLILIAHHANPEDLLMGDHLSDPAGVHLRAVLKEAGWDPASVYMTSAVKCAVERKLGSKSPAACGKICVIEWLKSELGQAPTESPICFLGVKVAGLVTKHGFDSLRGRPLYMLESEQKLLTAGQSGFHRWVEFFRRLRNASAKQ